MADAAVIADAPDTDAGQPDLDTKSSSLGAIIFLLVLLGGIGYAGAGIFRDIQSVHETLAISAFGLLGLALLIALGFEFVNGFHDTANAVATVIYTNSMVPWFAVVWSGAFNFLGVLTSTGAVAYGIITLLPVDLILQVGSTAGYAMIFALLLAAIVWNLGTWALGIPNSSSHALIGSIMGVGLANQYMAPLGQQTAGVDWSQATTVGEALLVSPFVGFLASALLLLALKFLIPIKSLYQAPKDKNPPPWWIRGILILTCTGVSYAHGGNDGQKGMGLIMLILIGVAPTAYALNRTMPDSATPAFISSTMAAEAVFTKHAGSAPAAAPDVARKTVGDALRTHKLNQPEVFSALAVISSDIAAQVKSYGSVGHVPAAQTPNVRNEMYMASDAVRLLPAAGAKFDKGESDALKTYQTNLQSGTRFIPDWVKICVAIALGLGTMVGWKRIVVTVGQKIGKHHMTYAQGMSAELVAAVTIWGGGALGLPLSTTHVLSSGVAGTMAANGSGLQWGTIWKIASAWVITLPAAMAISGGLYYLLQHYGVMHWIL